MDLYQNILLALAFIIDSFTISISFGLVERKESIIKNMNIIGLTCALGQITFLYLGWLVGSLIANFVTRLAPLIGFILLTGLSIYIAIEAVKKRNAGIEVIQSKINLRILLFLVIGTSFDVISVGITLGLIEQVITILTIITFVFTYISVYVGGFAGFKIGQKIEIYKAELFGALLIFLLGCSLFFFN